MVRALGGAATFTSDLDRLSVDTRDSTTRFEVEMPRAAPHVEVWVEGHRVLAKVGARVLSDGWRESDGRYLIPFSSAPR